MIDVEGLGQIFERSALEGGDGAVEVRIGGHDDHGQARESLLHLLEECQARLARHPDVRNEDARIARRERLQDFLGRDERLVGDVVALECLFEHPANRTIVVDDPDGFHHGVPLQVGVQWIGTHGVLPDIGGSSGSRTVNTVRPGVLSHSIAPACCATNACASVSPSPLPPSRPDTSG